MCITLFVFILQKFTAFYSGCLTITIISLKTMSHMHVHIHAYVNIYVGEGKRREAVHYAVCVNDVYTGEGSSCVDDDNIGEES